MPLMDITGYAEGFNENPYPFYEQMRKAGPVHRIKDTEGNDVWLIVGYDEARAALADPALHKDWRTHEQYAEQTRASEVNRNMLEMDPPHHTRLRKLVAREFTAHRIEALRPRVQELTDSLLDAMAAREDRRTDLIEALAFPLPMTVICELLGVPDLDREPFRVLSNEILAPASKESELKALQDMAVYLAGLIERKRAAGGDDLLSALIRTQDEDGDQLDGEELIGMAFLLLVAGHETTVNLIANGVRALLAHPEQLAALRADLDGLLDGAVEEMLRYDGPVENATFRFAREDMEIAGVAIAKGDPVLVSLGASSRDGARYPDPDTFDIRRATQGHLAFGHGIHFCIGAPLARMEARIAIRGLLERFPDLAEVPGEPYEWITASLIRGVRRLPVRW
ncbi:cytochrome P450 [Streptomyces bambusae]|uniref:cytochrome P450 family protein n=1 Tax=Streptomyces bambusae TaxID=1550616 RepID=UPI001CFF92AF|nr:cytochrome P450 [Streptomyces bambusae]MCB5169526.1 cytochrome P450 [Streptomyces bambusae]